MQKEILAGKNLENIIVDTRDLTPEEHGELLCYPGTDLATFDSRVSQARSLGVEALVLEGDSKIGRFGVVGKGCVSAVVKAKLQGEKDLVALKIRRVDANRPNMRRDFELQSYANSFGVGPRAISFSDDFFAMEFVDSIKLGRWFQSLKTRSSKKYLRKIVRGTLEQCYKLDAQGLDHGELSNPTKHVLIRKGTAETTIIDFESSSRERKTMNVTAVAQFFFLGSSQSEKVRKILGLDEKKKLLSKLRSYKGKKDKDSFGDLLEALDC